MGRRRTTVHDLASLRVHPDGTRTPYFLPPIPPLETDSTTGDASLHANGLRPRLEKYTTQDARGNLIARDAGGLGRVPYKFPASSSAKAAEDGESIDIDQIATPARLDGTENSDNLASEEVGRGKKRKGKDVKDRRAKKRRIFNEDLSFLDSPCSGVATPASRPTSSSAVRDVETDAHSTVSYDTQVIDAFSAPSSDLLKAIHHFATIYYSEKGQLIDASRDARRAKKEARLKRLQEAEDLDKAASPVSSDDDAAEKEVQSDEDEGNEAGSDDESRRSHTSIRSRTGSPIPGPSSSTKPVKGKAPHRRRKRRARSELRRDMYKAFDGSALVALGMLVQEHITGLLTPDIPDGWEEEMERCHDAPDDATGAVKRPKKKKRQRRGKAEAGVNKQRRRSAEAPEAGRDEAAQPHSGEEDQASVEEPISIPGNLFDGDIPNPALVIDNDDDSDYAP
ncbi:hypothetical protein OE88DRAFT_1666778 [Heliocybe sulcata]|uniref:Uncharacterized protein n=1 Tax=Heliocybe sulcata TaxID=5364 RepID=A0A5C3MNL6_9AGAM|nr:hypothetical protein OE88DRAFT_1666778 [Heliocybe sulcata]